MSWPRIALYYLLAIALAVYLQGELRRRHPVVEAPVATTVPFLSAVPERIDRLRAETDDLSIEFRRRDGRWVVTEPEGMVSPNDIVDAVLESLTSLPPIDVVADRAEQGQYGLNPPRIRVRIEAGGEILSTIAFGELNPTRTAVYAKKSGKEEIYLLGLNARYYLDLVFENVRRQITSSGAAPGAGASGLGDGGGQARDSAASAPAATPEPLLTEPAPQQAERAVKPVPSPKKPAGRVKHK